MNINERVEALEQLLAQQEAKLQAKTKTTVIVYAILILIVAAYTTFVAQKLREMTSREAAVELVGSWLSANVPAHRQAITDQLEANSEEYAKAVVRGALDTFLPAAEQQAQVVLVDLTDMLASAVEEQLIPAFSDYIREDTKGLKKQYAELTDKETGVVLARMFVASLEAEMDKWINEEFEERAAELQTKLLELGRKTEGLTRKEEAQKRALVCWAFLAEHGDTGESLYGDLIEAAGKKLDGVLDVLPDTK